MLRAAVAVVPRLAYLELAALAGAELAASIIQISHLVLMADQARQTLAAAAAELTTLPLMEVH
jgi:hypothetical protein